MGNVLNTQLQLRPCSGCGACQLSCPHSCIVMKINSDGFVRPYIDDSCKQCGLCVKTCFKFEQLTPETEKFWENKKIFSFKNKDSKVLLQSSSGGFIGALYKKYLNLGYTVCGAVYDTHENVVRHKAVITSDDITSLLGSKYLPSLTNEVFKQIKEDKKGKYVFVGTPCQIYGIHKWAATNKRREQFILIDFFCAGVPSYNLWKTYLKEINDKYTLGDILSISFRDKVESDWHHYGIRIKGSKGIYYQSNAASKDSFFKIFLSDSCKQLSCSNHNCFFRTAYCFSDIRIGDFWGNKFLDDSTGVSVVIANTTRGESVLSEFSDLINESGIQVCDLKEPQKEREMVMKALKNGEKMEKILSIIEHPTLFIKIKNIFKRLYNEKK